MAYSRMDHCEEIGVTPIAIISFNRPSYLEQVLRSLEAQTADLSRREICLFQDGTGDHDAKAKAEQCVSIFRSIFEGGRVFASEDSLGTAMNFDRAERHVFETLNADAAIFLEDDMVLGPSYLTVLERLLSISLADERIGYVSAFGNYRASRIEQLKKARQLRPLHLHWAFGLTKRHWLRCRPYVLEYLYLIRDVPYRNRDHEAIRALTSKWGIKPGDTAQDRIKAFATALVGCIKLNTEPAYAKYIGEDGINFTKEMFKQWGFEGNEYFSDPLSLDFDLSNVNFDPWFEGNNVWRL